MKKSLFVTFILMVTFVFPIMSNAMAPPPPPFAFPLPPPIPFVAPPELIIIPDTDIYAVPGLEDDLFFHQGWWWRHWSGRWYRSQWYDRGWDYYSGYPGWFEIVPPYWRDNYRNRRWGDRPWNPPHIHQGDLDRHWREGYGRDDRGWGPPDPRRRTRGGPDGRYGGPDDGPGGGPGGGPR